tara:strand:+ start:11679 stop:12260 length:582 start_codon:yes stop_codon:yes gene_type:complete
MSESPFDINSFDVSQLEEVVIDNPTTMGEVMSNIAAEMVYCLKATIDEKGVIYKGNLKDSVRMPIEMFGQKMTATLYMADYYDYINQGVKGIGGTRKSGTRENEPWEIKAPNSPYSFKKGPKVSHIREWSKSKGLNEYAVRASIAHKGIKPRYFFDDCMKETFTGEAFSKFKKDIRIVTTKKVTKGMKKIFKK